MDKTLSYTVIIKDLIRIICPEGSIGVEIGTNKGKSAKAILECANVKKVYLVDPYKVFPKHIYNGDSRQRVFDRRLRRAKKKLSIYDKDRYKFIRRTSISAAEKVNTPLDFVYIDGNHSYEFVKQDIETWFPKIKPGGLCLGDDWLDPHQGEWGELKGLHMAVREFSELNDSINVSANINGFGYKYHPRDNGLFVSPETRRQLRIWWVIKK